MLRYTKLDEAVAPQRACRATGSESIHLKSLRRNYKYFCFQIFQSLTFISFTTPTNPSHSQTNPQFLLSPSTQTHSITPLLLSQPPSNRSKCAKRPSQHTPAATSLRHSSTPPQWCPPLYSTMPSQTSPSTPIQPIFNQWHLRPSPPPSRPPVDHLIPRRAPSSQA